jgi:nitroreductase
MTSYDTDTSALLHSCLRSAAAAPSIHNTQPWLFRIRDDGIDVLIDRRRQLLTIDPDGREMHVSVGAAVFNLRVALAAQGRTAEVELAPDWYDDSLAARVRLGDATEAGPAALALFDAIGRRHTNRRPFADTPLAEPVAAELRTAARLEHATLYLADDPLRTAVLSLIRTADNRQRRDPGYRPEVAAWTTPPGIGRRDGVPRSAFGPRAADAVLPMRDLGIGHGAPTATVEFEPDPTIALLYTVGDDRRAWLQAGAALQRVWLTATVRGVAATPLTQTTEIPELRGLLTDPAAGVVQSVLRLGYPLSPARPALRRPVDELIID